MDGLLKIAVEISLFKISFDVVHLSFKYSDLENVGKGFKI